jgi:type II restriction/modification system DNA methylase subunit YeeA
MAAGRWFKKYDFMRPILMDKLESWEYGLKESAAHEAKIYHNFFLADSFFCILVSLRRWIDIYKILSRLFVWRRCLSN